MYGVSKINIEPSLMMISVQDAEFKGNTMARYLQITCHRVALELGILHTDHHQARLNIDFGYTVHSKHSILPIGRSDSNFMQAPKIRC